MSHADGGPTEGTAAPIATPETHDPSMAMMTSAPPAETAEPEASSRIYVGNIPWSVTDDELASQFSGMGSVVDAKVRLLATFSCLWGPRTGGESGLEVPGSTKDSASVDDCD
jgi:hypothetical protein